MSFGGDYTTGNRLFVDSSGGTFRIQGSANLQLFAPNHRISNSNGALILAGDTGVRLYYLNSEKLTTTSTGLKVSGNIKLGDDTMSTPSTNADDIVIDKDASEAGITMMSETAGSVRWGDASNSSVGSIEYNHNSDYMRFIVNAAERMRIDNSGNATFEGQVNITSAGSAHFGITNTNVSGSSQQYLQYVGSNGDYVFRNATDSTSPLVLAKNNNATFAGDVTVNGTITLGTASFVGTVAGATVVSAEGAYASSGSVKLYEAKRSGGAVGGDWSYDDATTDMSLGTNTNHAFSLKTNNTRRLTISNDGEIRVANQTLVKGSNSKYNMTFPDNGGIAIGSAYTFANVYGSSGDLYLRANSYPANTGSNSTIYLQTSNSSGGQANDVVIQNGNVGIGTTSPDYKLTINNTGGADTLLKLENTTSNKYPNIRLVALDASYDIGVGGTGTATGYVNNFYIYDVTNSAPRITLTQAGNVGIGTTSPSELLTVNGNMQLGNGGGGGYLKYNTGNLYIQGTSNIVATFESTGNVGIGTTSPAGLLTIKGTGDAIRVESTNTGAGGAQMDLLHFTTSPADGDTFGLINMGGYYTGTTSVYGTSIKSIWTDVSARDAALTFSTNNSGTLTEAMRITPGGSLEVGTATVAAANAAADNIVIKGEGTAVGLTISNSSNAGTGTIFFGDAASSAAAGFRYNHNTGDMAISAEDNITFACDNVGIGTTAPGTKLDVRGTGNFLGTAGSGAALVTIENNSGSTATSYGLLVKGGGNSSSGKTFEVRDDSGNTDLMVTGAGNVGINAATPRDKLTVFTAGSSEEEIGLRLVNPIGFTNAGSGASIIFAQDRSQAENIPMAKIRSSQNAGGSSCCGDLIFSTSHTSLGGMIDRMKITASGDVEMTVGGSFSIGGTTTSEAKTQTEHTGSVDSSGKIILSSISDGMSSATAAKVTVYGADNVSATFYDEIVISANSTTINVLHSINTVNTPPSRTYSVVSNQLKLVMGSGSYNVNVKSEAMGYPF